MRTKNKGNMIKRIITFPIRALIKARDSYVKGMTSLGERGSYGSFRAPVASSSRSSNLPKSFSVSSSGSNYESEDMRELIRAASVRRINGRLTEELLSRPHQMAAQQPESGVVPRSYSVAMGKIDENSPCEFGEELGGLGVVRKEVMYPRSKSHAVAKRSMIYV